MKKMILMIIASSSFMFAQTGMVTDSGMGVWLNAAVMNIDSDVNDMLDPAYALSFDYVMDNGLEIGLDYYLDYFGFNDYNPMDLHFTYHMNSGDKTWAFGLNMHDFTDDTDAGLDTMSIDVGGYCDTLLHWNLNYNLDAEEDEMSIQFGKLWEMDSMILGVGYAAGTEDLDMGWVTFSAGTTF